MNTALTSKRRDFNAEARIQAAIVEWVRTVAPELIIFHPPNGGLRSKAEAARFKWLGALAGVPDLVILGKDGRAWLLEVKTPSGYLSDNQRAVHGRCIALGIPFAVVRSIEDLHQAFAVWGIETREGAK